MRRKSISLEFATLCLLGAAVAALLTGCEIVPRGPVVEEKIFRGRPDGLVAIVKDSSFTRGYYFFADPKLTALDASLTNIFGGTSHIAAGSITIVVNSNIVPAIGAAGTAAGNIIGAAAKTAVK